MPIKVGYWPGRIDFGLWSPLTSGPLSPTSSTLLQKTFAIRVPLGGIGSSGPQSVADVIDGIGFWREGDDAPDSFLRYESYFVGLDAAGAAVWGTAREIRIADLVRAAQEGIVSFDPLRVYLHPTLPQGADVLMASWEAFAELWNAAWPIVEKVAAAHGAGQVLTALRRRFGRAPTLLKRRSELEERLAGPGQVIDLMASRSWSPDQLARTMSCSPEDAEELLDFAGLSLDPPIHAGGRTAEGLGGRASVLRGAARGEGLRPGD